MGVVKVMAEDLLLLCRLGSQSLGSVVAGLFALHQAMHFYVCMYVGQLRMSFQTRASTSKKEKQQFSAVRSRQGLFNDEFI